ncbi:hypothetical protein [Mucilaginibacter sp. CSA2-8R]|uniref:hypothetical protein n=1 Tax=Mucilaginibacter sp. CSA2-8R TaxID=3141542 RepID=UPI00315D1B53
MNSLSDLIKLLTVSDKKQFKQFLHQKNKRQDVKNLQLFNLIETDDIDRLNKLYDSKKNKDAYHALCKRLQDNLLIFLSQKTFENTNSDAHEALRLLVVGRFLLENDNIKIAFKCLDNAENIAVQLEQFNLLNELLLLKLQYAHLSGAEDLEILTARFTRNQLQMQREAKLNIAYAFLRQQLQQIHLNGKVVNLTALMIATIRKYKISVQDLMTYKSVYQILFIANEYAAIQQNYGLIERYINRTDQFIQNKPGDKQAYLFYHISILYYLANFYLRQRQFTKSRSYLQKMAGLMETDQRYYALFYLRYKLLQALNLFFTGSADDAISMLQESLSKIKLSSKPEEVEDLRICLAMFLALCNDKGSLKQLTLLTRTDAWYEKKMGMLWTIRKNLMEMLIQAQFANIDLAMSRLNSFRRRYKKYLLKTSEDRVLQFLKLVEKYLLQPNVVSETSYKNAVLSLLTKEGDSDIFTLSFIAWLIARCEKQTAYEVVLTVLRGERNSF